jgi:Mn2+/Fe2+ NRAMP family transporter
MKAGTIIGALLIVLGIIGFAAGGISFTHQKKDVDVGPIQLSHKETSTMPISPILSTVSLIAGAGLLVVGLRSKA